VGNLSGTQAATATAPAISRPATMSRMTAAHSITKTSDTEVKALPGHPHCGGVIAFIFADLIIEQTKLSRLTTGRPAQHRSGPESRPTARA
jgi:hypothetical protein